MKKILIILSVILISFSVEGQIIRASAPHRARATAAPTAPNMISNGTFDSGTGWSAGEHWTIGSGAASYVQTAASNLLQADADMNASVVNGGVYTLEFDITITSGSAQIEFVNGTNTGQYVPSAFYTAGHQVVHFTANEFAVYGFGVRGQMYGDNNWSIDNIVLTED